MYNKIKDDIVKAMKEKNTITLQTLRSVKGEIDLIHINSKVDITDELVLDVLTHQIKTRNESINEFQKGNRHDLIDKTNLEIEILKVYLPKQLTKEEVLDLVESVFQKVNPTSSKDMGLVMKEITPLVKGKYDMKELSIIIKERLSN